MKLIGRYAVFDEIARGGMASVHLGRLLGQGGFSRTVAIKKLHPHLARDPEFLAMLLDEARLVGRIQHPNVVSMLDVVVDEDDVILVMEYVEGLPLSRLLRVATSMEEPVPAAIAVALLTNSLRGLHAAHEAKNEGGEPLGLVHRDVTPHNLMVRRDGTALVLDFGVAKATGRFHTTEEGKIKGKLPYMAPEQLRGQGVTRRIDVYAAGAVLWETLVGERLFRGANEGELLEQVLFSAVSPPSAHRPLVSAKIDAVVMRALARNPEERFATAAEMADALEGALRPALSSEVATWLDRLASDPLAALSARVRAIESDESSAQDRMPESLRRALSRQAGEIGTGDVVAKAPPTSRPSAARDTAGQPESKREGTVSGATTPAPALVVNDIEATSSSVSLSRRERKSLWPLLAAALLVPVAVGAWYLGAHQTGARAAATASEVATAPPTSPAPSASAPAAPPPVVHPLSAAPPSETAPREVTAASTAPGRPLAKRAPRPAAHPTTAPKPANCVQIDAQGHKTYNRACFK